ncbi:MAG: hypothetical protein HKN32_08290, partial [Flavobacteriales bacterium]|nr:hypothetical protein [Flavobacteriales bacterium]
TNLGWDSNLEALVTHPLGPFSDHRLALNYSSYALEFIDDNGDTVSTMHLEGANHIAIINWLGEEGMRLELGELYVFDLHYELPYEDVDEDFHFPEPDYNEIQRLADMRTIAKQAIEHVIEVHGEEGESRVWPHHFDTGAVINLESQSPRSIGLGLAIPDSMIDGYYLYVSAWSADGSFQLDCMPALEIGEWMHPDWNGAVLPADEVNEKIAMTFFFHAVREANERHEVSA